MFALAVALLASSACASSGTSGSGTTPGGDTSPQTYVRLFYTRPALSTRTGRPDGFEIIRDYRSSDVVTKYDGIWNEDTQTLTDQVAFPIGSVNLIFVTPITASREGRLHEVPCPQVVNTMRACYELTVTRGH
jgi:hypothetical protein